jgi:hypothetical protein
MIVNRVDLGAAPIPYIRERLAWGHRLAAELLRLPLESGSVHAFLPEDASHENIMNFEDGAVLPPNWVVPGRVQRIDRDEIDDVEARFIRDYLRKNERNLAVFEDPNAEVGDPDLEGDQYFTDGTHVYLLLTNRDIEITGIIETMRVRAYYSLGVLASPAELVVAPGQQVQEDLFQSIALATDHILVGAYDGEADLIWSRQ